MQVCVFGAGAIGGLIGGRLAAAGADPLLVARGAHLAAMRRNGLRLDTGGQAFHMQVRATDTPARAGVQDVVFVCLKAHGLIDAAPAIAGLSGPETTLVMVLTW